MRCKWGARTLSAPVVRNPFACAFSATFPFVSTAHVTLKITAFPPPPPPPAQQRVNTVRHTHAQQNKSAYFYELANVSDVAGVVAWCLKSIIHCQSALPRQPTPGVYIHRSIYNLCDRCRRSAHALHRLPAEFGPQERATTIQ